MTIFANRHEWRSIDRTGWPRGEWDSEPDKVQWKDAATGLPCLAVRQPHSGNWCGYVGVSEAHPWHGKDYSDCTLPTAAPKGRKQGDDTMGERWAERMAKRLVCSEEWCDHRVDSKIEVHGGLTFSRACADTSHGSWLQWRTWMNDRRAEAEKYPEGDSARDLREWAAALESYDTWLATSQARHVCHIPAPGEPDHVWWFGFDCSHAWDVSPARRDTYVSWGIGYYRQYRTLGFVQRQCAKLAAQLVERAKP